MIHGAKDTLIPPNHGTALYKASPVDDKELLIIEGGSHNNVAVVQLQKYFGAIRRFVAAHLRL